MKRILLNAAAVAGAWTCHAAPPGGPDDRLPEAEIPALTLNDAFVIDRKEPGFLTRRPGEKTPAAQLERARRFEEAGRHERARMAYNSLVRHWHNEPEAPGAQTKAAEMRELQGDLEEAFKEYQYLFAHFAGRFDFNDILQRQWKIANALAGRKKTFLGVTVQTHEEDRLRCEQIAVNAPNGALAPDALLKAAAYHELDGEFPAAADAYARLRVRHPASAQAPTAAHAEARCRYAQSLKHPKDDALTRQSIAAIDAILLQFPRLPERDELKEWRATLQAKREEDAFRQAQFYDLHNRQPRAALTAYRQFLRDHPASARVDEARARVRQLEAQLEPPDTHP